MSNKTFSTLGVVVFFLGLAVLGVAAILMIIGIWTDRRLLLTGGVGVFIAIATCVIGSAMVQVADDTPKKRAF